MARPQHGHIFPKDRVPGGQRLNRLLRSPQPSPLGRHLGHPHTWTVLPEVHAAPGKHEKEGVSRAAQ